jgi:hypothetical protein
VQQLKQQHLYLLLDDWDRGYIIHRLDVVDAFDSDAEAVHRAADRPHRNSARKVVELRLPRLQDLRDEAQTRIQPCHPGLRRPHAGPDYLPVAVLPCAPRHPPLRLRRWQPTPSCSWKTARVPRRPAAVRQRRRVVLLDGRRRAAPAVLQRLRRSPLLRRAPGRLHLLRVLRRRHLRRRAPRVRVRTAVTGFCRSMAKPTSMPGWKRGSVSVVRETRLGNLFLRCSVRSRPSSRARRRGRSARTRSPFDKRSPRCTGAPGSCTWAGTASSLPRRVHVPERRQAVSSSHISMIWLSGTQLQFLIQ